MSGQLRRLRVEEPAERVVEEAARVSPSDQPAPAPAAPVVQDVDYWRRIAIQTGERLSYAENQLKDLRAAADDARARFGKYKSRSDAANARVNDLQVEVVRISAERDALRAQVAHQDVLARKVHEYRQSLLAGPIWELFAELVVCPPEKAGEGEAHV